MRKIKKIAWLFLHKTFPAWLHGSNSYSQTGEDMVLRRLVNQQKNYKGFYVDVGAHHPFRFSNTAYFYKQGWCGINIEASPDLIPAFAKLRKRDINLNVAIGLSVDPLTFFIFNEQALNTFDKDLAMSRTQGKSKIAKTVDIKQIKLSEALDKYLKTNQKIDFLSIDVEGMDLEVLKSNDWTKYAPDCILIESEINLMAPAENEVYNYLVNLQYELIAQTQITAVFRKIKTE